MAHFAEIDQNNKVLRVLVIPDDQEDRGSDYLSVDLGLGGTWLKTSYNTFGGVHSLGEYHVGGGTPFRKNFAAIGFEYNPDLDAFVAPQPDPSWILNEETCLWEDPNKESK